MLNSGTSPLLSLHSKVEETNADTDIYKKRQNDTC